MEIIFSLQLALQRLRSLFLTQFNLSKAWLSHFMYSYNLNILNVVIRRWNQWGHWFILQNSERSLLLMSQHLGKYFHLINAENVATQIPNHTYQSRWKSWIFLWNNITKGRKSYQCWTNSVFTHLHIVLKTFYIKVPNQTCPRVPSIKTSKYHV